MLLATAVGTCGTARAVERPNFVIIFTDDQGYQDLGCFGSPNIKTPRIDRMAREGMRFTDFYAAASVCTPSRAALMTGSYPERAGNLPILYPRSNVGLSPDEFRRRNLLNKGDTTATGQTIEEEIDLSALLSSALDKAGWAEKRARFAKSNADPNETIKRGMGLATFYHGSGFTGSGEVYLASVVHARANAEGIVEILAASTDFDNCKE